MGSGIKIAMRDLEIRGAGNILGAEQHGHMEKIGYELYSKLLKEELSGETEVAPELDIRVTAFIPDGYIESNVARMDAYKEIAEIKSLDAEKEFRTSIEDVYGRLPEEADSLIDIAVVKMLATKKAAKAVSEKNVEMLKSKDLLPLTGYVHGGCSPIGMKKFFTTTIDKSAENFDTIIFSADKIGYQVEMSLADLAKMIRFTTNDLTV